MSKHRTERRYGIALIGYCRYIFRGLTPGKKKNAPGQAFGRREGGRQKTSLIRILNRRPRCSPRLISFGAKEAVNCSALIGPETSISQFLLQSFSLEV